MKDRADFARGLALKAESDWAAASTCLERDVALDAVCFHLQQMSEKLLKALLAWQEVRYPFTHDLRDLLDLAVARFPALAEFYSSLPGYSDFAVDLRYDDAWFPTREETLAAFENVRRLREVIHSLLPPKARP